VKREESQWDADEYNICVGIYHDGHEHEPRGLFRGKGSAYSYASALSTTSGHTVYVRDAWGSKFFRNGQPLDGGMVEGKPQHEDA
jgi:hypothetical protein